MAAAMNGMALHGGIVPYSGTFLVFSDYCRPAIRLAALMGKRVIHVMTHDFDRPRRRRTDASAGRASRRAARNSESAACSVPATRWKQPSAGSSRSKRKTGRAYWRSRGRTCRSCATASTRTISARAALMKSRGPDGRSDVSIFATGSEVSIAVDGAKLLAQRGVAARVVSVPCFELFLEQKADYRRAIIGDARVKIGVEAAIRQGWDAIIGSDGIFVGMTIVRRQRAVQGTVQEIWDYRRSDRQRGVGEAWEDVTSRLYVCRGRPRPRQS